ncbi:MAG TPA: DMT family transporter [Paludibacter sp.]|nr:DMT family transporter [Paludibacter sp.]
MHYELLNYELPMWLILAFISAILLGSYEVFKKVSLEKNAVIPVIFVSILFSCLTLTPFLILSEFLPGTLRGTIFFVPRVDFHAHMLFVLKATIVLTSWLFAYFALKHLPISLASPIKATQPMWTVLGALLIFGEKLNGYQAAGIGVTLVSFFLFSVIGKREGISMRTNKWFWFIVMATLTGALSGLYDKYLMNKYDVMSVQVYYTFYQAIIMGLITVFLWYPTRKATTPFRFKWAIFWISTFLVTADFVYFYALTLPGSMISIVSTIRRSGVIVPFLYGAMVLHDKNIKLKMIDLIGVLIGMYLLYLGSK